MSDKIDSELESRGTLVKIKTPLRKIDKHCWDCREQAVGTLDLAAVCEYETNHDE